MAPLPRWRWTVGVACVLALACAIATATLKAQERLTFFLFAADATGAPVVDLKASDVTVKEDAGVARTVNVEHFEWPVKLTILLDNGPRARDMVPHYRNGLEKLFEGLPTGLPVTLIATAPQPRWLLRDATSRQDFKKGIGLITADDSLGRFADSLIEYAKRLDAEFRSGGPDRQPYLPVVIAISNTDHDGSNVTREQNLRMVQSLRTHRVWTNFVMFRPGKAGTAAMDRDAAFDDGPGQTGELAKVVQENTSGRYFALSGAGLSGLGTKILPDLAKDIALRHVKQMNQYRVVFERVPTATGAPTGVSVSLNRPGLELSLSMDGTMP